MFPWQPSLFQSPLTWFQHVSDFQFEKHQTRPWTRPNIFIPSLALTDELPLTNHYGKRKVARKAILSKKSGTQYVAMVRTTVKLMLWRTSRRILLQRINYSWCKLVSLFIIIRLKKFSWVDDVIIFANLHIFLLLLTTSLCFKMA